MQVLMPKNFYPFFMIFYEIGTSQPKIDNLFRFFASHRALHRCCDKKDSTNQTSDS